MARNKLSDLNNHLFAQLERLEDEGLKPEELQIEIERSKAVAIISKEIIGNARLTFEAAKFTANKLPMDKSLPAQFELNEKN